MNKKIIGIFISLILCFASYSIAGMKTYEKNYEFNQSDNEFHTTDDENIGKKLFTIRKAIEEKNANWTADFTHISNSTFYSECNFNLYEENEEYIDDFEPILIEGNLPSKFDWRDVDGINWITPIKNQKTCGSCVAFGVIAALEAVIQIEVGSVFNCDLSEAHLFSCGGGDCDSGWKRSEASDYIKFNGVPDEACFPYEPYDRSCDQSDSNWKERAVKASYGRTGSHNQMKNALIEYGPVVTAFNIYDDFYYYTGGIYERVSGVYKGSHAVAIIGYNDNPGYWICKNSWGTYWGEEGYFNIKYGECSIEDNNVYYYYDISGNIQPFQPINPNPINSEVDVDVDVNLSWIGGDPNPGDIVEYKIYFGTTNPPTNHVETLNKNFYYPEYLDKDTHYYWKVNAIDNHGSITEGEVWEFWSEDTRPPTTWFKKPINRALYINNNDMILLSVFFETTTIIGPINVEVFASDDNSGIEKVEFYVDDSLKSVIVEIPYEYYLDETMLFKHSLIIVTYDKAGNSDSYEIIARCFII